MSIFSAVPIFDYASNYINSFFTLDVKATPKHTSITMHLKYPVVNTAKIPATYTVLKKMLPTILISQCYNEGNLPFYKEVRETEIGHLFEHIILEYLCEGKLANGCNEAAYAGKTNWDWLHDPYGTFHIVISSGEEDIDIFPHALEKSISLLKYILAIEEKQTLFYTHDGYLS
jgi:hypothetical protein